MEQQLCNFTLCSWAEVGWIAATREVAGSLEKGWAGSLAEGRWLLEGGCAGGESGLTDVFTVPEKIQLCPLFPDETWVHCSRELGAADIADRL